MFGCRSFLMLGSAGAADIVSLAKGGNELLEYRYAFEQGIDDKGKATTKVYGGTLHITLPQLPPQAIIEWALTSRKYSDGTIIMLDAENMPLEKILFKNANCIGLSIDYTQSGETYVATSIVVQAQKLIVGNGVDFDNEWTY